MKDKQKQAAAYLTWRTAWRMRCCPPENLLYAEKTSELVEHLRLCPWCKAELDNRDEKPDFPSFPEQEKEKTEPQPGQLWSLKHELSGWGPKDRYYSSPLVVIIQINDKSVVVCQCYGDMDLAAKDDQPFQTDLVGFVQPWNRYSLRLEDLDRCYGKVLNTVDQNLLFPECSREQLIETGSLHWFFRQMEVETGYYFSRQAVSSMMAEYEQAGSETSDTLLTFLSTDKKHLQKQFNSMGLVFPHPPSAGSTLSELLFLAQPTDEMLPLAAADRRESTEYALCFTIQEGEIVSVETRGLNITTWSREGALLHISGSLKKPVFVSAQPLFRLQTKTRQFDPLPGNYGVEGDFFWVLFEVGDADIEEGECIVRIIADKK